MKNKNRRSLYYNFTSSFQNNTQFLYKINQLLVERNLLQPYQRILIAVSGGQDSVCLLHVLCRLSNKWNWKVGIVHCDHQWSTSSLNQAKHVSRIATIMQVNYYQTVTTRPVNTEQFARTWRYEIMQRISNLHNYQSLLTGHSSSDRIETLFHNLLRGSGFNGLKSITWKKSLNTSLIIRKKIQRPSLFWYSKKVIFRFHFQKMIQEQKQPPLYLIRPFLNITRIELQQIIRQWKLPVYLDITNQNMAIRRNRIRHQLLPYLRKYFNPKIDYVLSNLTEIVHAELLYLNSITSSIYSKNHIFLDKDLRINAKFDLQLIRALPLAIQRRILKRFLDTYTGMSTKFEHIEQIRIAILGTTNLCTFQKQYINSNKKVFNIQKCFCLPGKFILYIECKHIMLTTI